MLVRTNCVFDQDKGVLALLDISNNSLTQGRRAGHRFRHAAAAQAAAAAVAAAAAACYRGGGGVGALPAVFESSGYDSGGDGEYTTDMSGIIALGQALVRTLCKMLTGLTNHVSDLGQGVVVLHQPPRQFDWSRTSTSTAEDQGSEAWSDDPVWP